MGGVEELRPPRSSSSCSNFSDSSMPWVISTQGELRFASSSSSCISADNDLLEVDANSSFRVLEIAIAMLFWSSSSAEVPPLPSISNSSD